MRRIALVVAVLVLSLSSRSARAQIIAPWGAALDVLVLRDGSRVEGHAIDVHIGNSATIRTEEGTLRVVQWTDVEHASGPAFGAPGAPTHVAPPAPPASESDEIQSRYLEPLPGTIPVQVMSDGAPLLISAVLEARNLTTRAIGFGERDDSLPPLFGATGATIDAPRPVIRTRLLCVTPCTLHLPAGHTALHVGGEGRLESVQTVDVQHRPMRFTFRSASSTTFGAGVVLTLFGAALSAAGSFALLIEGTSTGSSGQPLLPFAVGCLLAGAFGLSIGIPILSVTHPGIERSEPIGTPHAPSLTASLTAHWIGDTAVAGVRVVF